MFPLRALPMELFIHVLHYVDTCDLLKLTTFPETRAVMKRLICWVKDTGDKYNRTTGSCVLLNDVDQIHVEKKLRVAPIVIVVISDLKESLPSLISVSKVYPDTRLVLTGSTGKYFHSCSISGPMLLELQKNFRSPVFHSRVRHLAFNDSTIDSLVFRLGTLKTLKLENCKTTASANFKFTLPSLTFLAVSGTFASIQSSLDFEKIPLLTVLRLQSIQDTDSLEHLHCASLKELHIIQDDGSPITSLNDLYLKSLREFKVEGASLTSISDVFLGEMESFSLFDYQTDPDSKTSLHRVQISNVKQLDIMISSQLSVSVVSFPSLASAKIELTSSGFAIINSRHNDLSGLKKTSTLSLANCMDYFIWSHPEIARNLTELSVEVCESSFLSQCSSSPAHFPNVKRLTLHFGEHHPELEKVSDIFPSVLYLTITTDISAQVTKLVHNGLKTLSIVVRRTSSLHVTNCSFQSLRYLNVSTESGEVLTALTLSISAPNLNRLHLSGLEANVFRLVRFPELETFTISGCVRVIDLGFDCTKLAKISIENNPTLTKVQCFFELKRLKCIKGVQTPYISDFKMLKARMLEKKATYTWRPSNQSSGSVNGDWERRVKPQSGKKAKSTI